MPASSWPSMLELSLPSRPPMGVVPSSSRDYGPRRGRCSPRAPRTRILYLLEKSARSLARSARTCARKESARYRPRQPRPSSRATPRLKDMAAINGGTDTRQQPPPPLSLSSPPPGWTAFDVDPFLCRRKIPGHPVARVIHIRRPGPSAAGSRDSSLTRRAVSLGFLRLVPPPPSPPRQNFRRGLTDF